MEHRPSPVRKGTTVLQLSANLTMLFTERDVVARFGAARAAGFSGVEFLFPYEHDVDAIEAALKEHDLKLVLFNFPAGNFAAGERGTANDPSRVEQFRQGVVMAVELAERLGTPALNCLVGRELPGVPLEEQRRTMVENLRFAAEEAARRGVKACVEPLNTIDTPGFMLGTAREALALIDETGHDNLWLQLDIYHEQRMAGNVTATFREFASRIGHIQIADSPERHQPGSGELNYHYILDAIAESDYQGWVGLEFVPDPDTESALREMREAGLLRL